MPSTPVYPKSNAVIKASKRNYNAVLAAVQAVNQNKSAVIATMGGVIVVAGAIWSALCSLVGHLCTIAAVMIHIKTATLGQVMAKYDDVFYAILVKMV